MTRNQFLRPTSARELLEAPGSRSIGDEVGLALRAHRRRLRLSQRAYATLRGYSRATWGRLESAAGGHRLEDVVRALEGTGCALYLGLAPESPTSGGGVLGPANVADRDADRACTTPFAGAPGAALPEHWPRTELLAGVRCGGGRFPGPLDTIQVDNLPRWWGIHELFVGPTERPNWHSPRPWARVEPSHIYPVGELFELASPSSTGQPREDVA